MRFKIASDGDLAEEFDKTKSNFVRTGFSKQGDDVDYSFTAMKPTDIIRKMFVHIKSGLDLLGCELLIY